MGERGQCHHGTVGQGGERGELFLGEKAALVEQGVLGGGDDGPLRLTEGDLGRGRRAALSIGVGLGARMAWKVLHGGRKRGSWWSRRPR